MKRIGFISLLVAALTTTFLVGGTTGQDSDADQQAGTSVDEKKVEIIKADPISSGYVILDGRYLPHPYNLEKRGEQLWVNDQLASETWFAQERRPGPRRPGGGFGRHRWDGPGPRQGEDSGSPEGEGFEPWEADRPGPGWGRPRGRGMSGSPRRSGLAQIQRVLEKNGMLIASQEYRGGTLVETDAALIVNVLHSGDSQEEKLAAIRKIAPYNTRMADGNWELLIESYEPSEQLFERISPEIERALEMIEENQLRHEAALASEFWNSRPLKYVITLMAMGLVVAACGTLLNYRPQGRAAWSEVDANGDGIPLVVRSVVLLILLGIFDLGCTLVAQRAGGFTEMNPLGSQLVENPALLTTFKLTTLLLACAILYALRRYRGAQVASWWMCLLCTVLTFRWLTYNSMFMT